MVAKVNTKGQMVLPNDYRKKLGIKANSQVEVRLNNNYISISPIKGVISAVSEEDTYASILKDSQGKWGKSAEAKVDKNTERSKINKIKDSRW